jgi:hypothetical protein
MEWNSDWKKRALWVLRKEGRKCTERHGFHKRISGDLKGSQGCAAPSIYSSHEKGEMSGEPMILDGPGQSSKGKDFRRHGGDACDPEWDGRYVQ